MKIAEKIYRSFFGRIMSAFARCVTKFQKPIMIYGFKDPESRKFRKFTRISSSVVIQNPENLSIADNVWVSQYSIIDCIGGVTIEEGAQIGAWVGIFSHGSECSIRLLGKEYVNIPNKERRGYTFGAVKIGKFTFIGAKSIILPGVTIGKGCIISAGSIVNKDVPDYSIFAGGNILPKTTIEKDAKFFKEFDFSSTYYDSDALEMIKKMNNDSIS